MVQACNVDLFCEDWHSATRTSGKPQLHSTVFHWSRELRAKLGFFSCSVRHLIYERVEIPKLRQDQKMDAQLDIKLWCRWYIAGKIGTRSLRGEPWSLCDSDVVLRLRTRQFELSTCCLITLLFSSSRYKRFRGEDFFIICWASAILLLKLCLNLQHVETDEKLIMAMRRAVFYFSALSSGSKRACNTWMIFCLLVEKVSQRYQFDMLLDVPQNASWSMHWARSTLPRVQQYWVCGVNRLSTRCPDMEAGKTGEPKGVDLGTTLYSMCRNYFIDLSDCYILY